MRRTYTLDIWSHEGLDLPDISRSLEIVSQEIPDYALVLQEVMWVLALPSLSLAIVCELFPDGSATHVSTQENVQRGSRVEQEGYIHV